MLIVPSGPNFQFCADNLGATAAMGTAVSWGGSSADGAAVTLLAALAHDAAVVTIGHRFLGTDIEDNNGLLDILYDPAGGAAWSVLIEDIAGGGQAGAFGATHYQQFPVRVPAGSSIGARARKAGATAVSGNVAIAVQGGPSHHGRFWSGQGVETLGAVPASSRGTFVTPGASGAFGSWTTIGTSTRRYGWLEMGLGSSDADMVASLGYVFEIGVGSVQLPGLPRRWLSAQATERIGMVQLVAPSWCDIPSGTVLQVRAACSGATPENISVTLHGVY